MNILHTITSLDPKTGGTAEAVFRISEAMNDQGHKVTILTIDPPDRELLRTSSNISLIKTGPGKFGSFNYSHKFSAWLDENIKDFDAVIIHGLWQHTGFASASACRKHGIPYSVFTHGMLDPWFNTTYPLKKLKKYLYWRWGEYRVLRDAAFVFFTCEEESKLAATSFSPYRVNSAVVGLGTERPPYSREELLDDSELPVNSTWAANPYFLYISRIHEKKGLDMLLPAYVALKEEFSDLPDLVIAGPESQQDYASKLKSDYNYDNIHWVGSLSGKEKWLALARAEAMILPSHQENFGIVVAESLAIGTPVLISDKVNIHHEVSNTETGLVAPDTLEGTENLLRRWLSKSQAEKESMSRACQRAFDSHFEIGRTAERIITHINH